MAVSIHFVQETAAKTRFKSLRGILKKDAACPTAVCDSAAAVWLRDGVYLPWKKPTTRHKVHGWTDYRGLNSDEYKVVLHERPWSNVDQTSCWSDTRYVGLDPSCSPQASVSGSPPAPLQEPEAKRHRGRCLTLLFMESLVSERTGVVLRRRAKGYDLREEVGGGSFSNVFRALRLRDHADVAIKRLKQPLDQKGTVIISSAQEMYVHERCVGHPNIVQILDGFILQDRVHIVLEFHGRSLRGIAEARGFVPSELRVIALHLLNALGYLHDELGLVHADLTDNNCLADDAFVVKLADFGSCVSEHEEERPDYNVQVQRGNPLLLTTVPYRAPEVLLGCTGFGPSVDIWALGVMLLQFAGLKFTRRTVTANHKHDAAEALQAIFAQLGSPNEAIVAELQGLPFWPVVPPNRERQAHIPAVSDALRPEGVSFVDSCLSWRAESRPTASQALGSPFLTGCLPLVGGCEKYKGQRHYWNAVGGNIFPDVLAWLREDPGFELLGHLLRDVLDENVPKLPQHVQRADLSHGAVKMTVGGYLTANATSAMMNKVNVEKPLLLGRFMQWRQAFVSVNAADVRILQRELRALLQGLENIGQDGQLFLENDVLTWLLSVAEIHVTLRRSRTLLAEDLHHDGGASILHLGSTLWGRRRVAFKQEEVQGKTTKDPTPTVGPDVVVPCGPGHVYLGGVTGARHQVEHPEYDDADMWTGSGFGPCSVAIMCRCTVWPNRGRNMYQTPGPLHVFEAVNTCCRNFLARATLRAPTLAECQDQVVDSSTPKN